MRNNDSIKHISTRTRRWQPYRAWFAPVLLALVFHIAFWWLPLRLEGKKPEPPKPVRLKLSFVTPPPTPPRQRVQKPRPRAPQPRKRVRRRRRKIRRRRIRRKRIVRKRVIPKKVVARRLPPPPPTPTPQPPVRKVAKATPPTPPPVPLQRKSQPKPKPVNLGPYRSLLGRSIKRHKRYPRIAARMGLQGLVVVLIRISKKGTLVGRPKVVRSSGHGMLDREAVRMIVAAAPFKSMPRGYLRTSAEFRLPINFKLANDDDS